MVQHADIDHTGITGVGGAITVEDEGTPLATAASTLDFVGAGVTASGAGATKTITIPGGAGVTVEDEGTPLATVADTLDFVGAGVVASGTGTTKTITISGGGGGLTHAYAGTNAIGASTEAITNRRQYMQKVTLANDCMIESVGAYVRQVNAGNVMGFGVGVLSDNSNAPKNVLAFNMGPSPSSYLSTAIGVQGDARWFHMAVGLWAPAGDYWLAVSIVVAGADSYQLYYDAGGDRYHDNAAWWISDAASGHADSTRKYSIRASTIR